jgi:undecaprenyl-diphosphatase
MRRALTVALATTLLGLAFLHLGSEAVEGDTGPFDRWGLVQAQALRAAHPGWVVVLRDLSALGGTTVLALFTVLAAGYLLVIRKPRTALLIVVAALAGTATVSAFKLAFGRLRPEAAAADAVVTGLSFPSGHASMSAIVFLTLGALIAAQRRSAAERAFILAAAVLLTLLVGASRTLLGVHWFTDVVGGWAFGTGWALLWLLLDRAWRPSGSTGLATDPSHP